MSRVWVAQGLGCRIVFLSAHFAQGAREALYTCTLRLRVWGLGYRVSGGIRGLYLPRPI